MWLDTMFHELHFVNNCSNISNIPVLFCRVSFSTCFPQSVVTSAKCNATYICSHITVLWIMGTVFKFKDPVIPQLEHNNLPVSVCLWQLCPCSAISLCGFCWKQDFDLLLSRKKSSEYINYSWVTLLICPFPVRPAYHERLWLRG